MIPNIRKGKSFVGAGRYYLHDKENDATTPNELKPKTSDRVAWTETRNCANTDPELAFIEMWKTADDQAYLKIASGQAMGGRKTTDPVKTISLSWHPTETPTREDMIAAADGFLAKMGWSEHQAVYLAHNDTAHPHMHIVLNRVHPETGMTLDDYKDKKRSQAWALDYEREHGHIWCEKRLEAENDNNRNLPHNVIEMTRAAERQYVADERTREDLDKLERDLLKQNQRAEREQFFEDGKLLFKENRLAVFEEVRAEFKDTWREYYNDKKEREAEAEAASGSAVTRALHFAKDGDFKQAWAAFSDKDAVRDTVRTEFSERRAEIRQEQLAETRLRQDVSGDELRLQRDDDYKALKERQAAERAEMRALHAQGERASELVAQTLDVRTANENLDPAAKQPTAANSNPAPQNDRAAGAGSSLSAVPSPEIMAPVPSEQVQSIVDGSFVHTNREDAGNTANFERGITGAADAGAGVVGGLASYLADELGELIAPTPPEVREARAKAAAKAEAEQPVVENPYLKHVPAATGMSESERDDKTRDDYWDKERERRLER
jgi:hypothetical protein